MACFSISITLKIEEMFLDGSTSLMFGTIVELLATRPFIMVIFSSVDRFYTTDQLAPISIAEWYSFRSTEEIFGFYAEAINGQKRKYSDFSSQRCVSMKLLVANRCRAINLIQGRS